MKKNLHCHLVFIFCCCLCLMLTSACSPKYIVQGRTIQGRVVDLDTGRPLTDAAVAIRWMTARDHRDSGSSVTLKAAQDITDEEGLFRIPVFSDREFAMGVYKEGYVCWFNQENFLKNEGINEVTLGHVTINPTMEDGMEIRLTPFKATYSRVRHAGFTVQVAAQCTDTHTGPFHQAIRSEYKIWQDNLRENFKKLVGRNEALRPAYFGP